MKKLVLLAIIIVLGAIVTALVDDTVGIKFAVAPLWASVAHKITYMLWGAIILLVLGTKKV
ncbi:MAG: hypothetical protein WC863_02475 [Patescibacteria group bacterium]